MPHTPLETHDERPSVLDHPAVGTPITRLGVSLFPVVLPGALGHVVATRDAEALDIEELEAESVPSLRVRNTRSKPFLLVEGETVAGGLQQRTLNVSVLVGAGQELDVPVSCVEAGRWGGERRFAGTSVRASRRVRRAKAEGVADNLRRTASRSSDQGAVWDAVNVELSRLDMASPTANFADSEAVFERDRALGRAAEELVGLGPLPGQQGVVIAHGSRIVAAEVFGSPELLAAQWEPTVRAALLDFPAQVRGRPSATAALRFLRRVANTPAHGSDGVGLGRELHVRTDRIVGQVLEWDACLVHASAFALAA